MRPNLLYLMFLIASLASCENNNSNSKEKSKDSTRKYATFSIEFPENDFPLRKRVSKSIYHEGNTLNDWILEGREHDASFVYFLTQDYIDASITKLSISTSVGKEAYLSGLLSSSISKFNTTNVSLKVGKYKNFTMVEASGDIIENTQKGIAKYRAYTNGFDFFLIGIAGQNYNDSIADKFLNSFEINGISHDHLQ